MLYFGAGLNKLLDPDWRSGQFFEYWFGHRHIWYLRIADYLPDLLLSKVVSWTSFCTELGLSTMMLLQRFYSLAIWVGLVLHTGMLVLTNTTFGMFYFAACASYLMFVNWPQDRMTVLYDGHCGLCMKLKNFFERVDLEQRFEWVAFQQAELAHQRITDSQLRESLYLLVGEQQYCGFAALRMLTLYNPLTYFALMFALRTPDVLHQRRWIALGVLLLFSPFMTPIGKHIYRAVARNREIGTTGCPPQ
jgi:predicted DCC family thiol-disulfide oxidoreductase YuxK